MAKQARRINDMRVLDLTRKNVERLRKGSHTKEEIEQYIDQDVPNSDQALKLKHDIYTTHAEYLDYILDKIKIINAGASKLSFSASSNKLITVYPHAKVIKKHPLKLETEYKPHKSYFIADPELFERYLEKEELKEMQELYNLSLRAVNMLVRQDKRAIVNEYWFKLVTEQGYSITKIADLFNISYTTVSGAVLKLKESKEKETDGIVWKYFDLS